MPSATVKRRSYRARPTIDALEVGGPRRRPGARRSSSVADPARARSPAPRRLRRRLRPARRGPGPPSSRRPRSACRGSAPTPRRAQLRDGLGRRPAHRPRSSPASDDLAAARVDRDDDALAVARRAARSRNSGSRSAAVPITTRSAPAVEHRVDRRPASRSPPPTWIGQSTAAAIRRTVSRFCGLARPGAVEVDDVQEARPVLGPARARRRPGRRRRRSRARSRPGAGAPPGRRGCRSPGRGSRRDGTAAQIPAKLASSRSPAALDFSGWNWTPKTLSRSPRRRSARRRRRCRAGRRGCRPRREGVDEVERRLRCRSPRPGGDSRSQRTGDQPMCGTLRPPASSSATSPGEQAEARPRRRARWSSSNSSCRPRQMPSIGTPGLAPLGDQLVEPAARGPAPSPSGRRRRRAGSRRRRRAPRPRRW